MEYIAHHGIKGQKWGERKYQYKDGSLTPEGRKRYGVVGSTKAYIQQRRNNVTKFYKESKNLGDTKTPSEMTKKERAIYDKAEADYRRRQKAAGEQFKSDLKRGIQDKRNQALKKQARRGDSFSFDSVRRMSINMTVGETASRAVGKALINKAMKNNPNLKISDDDFKRLVDKAGNFGKSAGAAYTRYQTVQGKVARKKLYGDANAVPWVEEMSIYNKNRRK